MTTLVNLTPHDISIVGDDTRVLVSYPASGAVARCAAHFRPDALREDGVMVGSMTYGGVEGLAAPLAGTCFIVSLLVKLACPDRADLLVPVLEVRDERGAIVGCRGLASSLGWEQ